MFSLYATHNAGELQKSMGESPSTEGEVYFVRFGDGRMLGQIRDVDIFGFVSSTLHLYVWYKVNCLVDVTQI